MNSNHLTEPAETGNYEASASALTQSMNLPMVHAGKINIIKVSKQGNSFGKNHWHSWIFKFYFPPQNTVTGINLQSSAGKRNTYQEFVDMSGKK